MALITVDSINLKLEGNSKSDILRELANAAYKDGKVSSEEGFYEGLMFRESESTTGFGNAFAVPHSKSEYAKEVGIVFGRSTKDIEWDALDGNPVNTFICLIAPKEGADDHLRLLSKICRKLMHESFTETLKTGTAEEVFKAITEVVEV